MKKTSFGSRVALTMAALSLGLAITASAQTISGNVKNNSAWANSPTITPPGDGSGSGTIRVGLWNSSASVEGPPSHIQTLAGPVPLPGAPGPFAYSLGGALADGSYYVVAWVDGNGNSEYDLGEPRSGLAIATIASGAPVTGFNVTIVDDSDNDGLADWWEAHWFSGSTDPLGHNGAEDSDGDGLSNKQEFDLYQTYAPNMFLNPANWDTDGDGLDDKWEYDHMFDVLISGIGLNPVVPDEGLDPDGDGLSNWQEYTGADGLPRMIFDKVENGSVVGKINSLTSDDLNPLDIDTDYDMLIDSFEVAWFDPTNHIDPKVGILNAPPDNSGGVDVSIAREDLDNDGLSNYREMCLLQEFRQGDVNGFMWTWTNRVPFPQVVYQTDDSKLVRVVLMSTMGTNLNLGLFPFVSTTVFTNRFMLRNHDWTKPSPGTGYSFVDEPNIRGYDTDGDDLPDGWEVEFNLDPRDDGTIGESSPGYKDGPNGKFGDPDADGLLNYSEYLGQDGNRSTTKPYVNGTGDETNPNKHNWRPDSTYLWRWYPTNRPTSYLTDPRAGTGLSRNETLGSALPSISIGTDNGLDSDDDGIPDIEEINPTNAGAFASSPVHSADPFIQRSALITSTAGLLIPDPEPQLASGSTPAGVREDLQRRDWSIEVSVKLLANNMNGDLFNFATRLGSASRTVYRLQLVTNTPILTAQGADGTTFTIQANPLPTNQWVHLAATWDHANNSLALYVQGVLFLGRAAFNESVSSFMFPATNVLAFGASPDGTFVNNLALDEIRIWGLARSPRQIADYARSMIPQNNGDDVWLDNGNDIYFGTNDTLLVNGGSLFDGEPGVPLANVMTAGGNYWLDNGNGYFESATDIVLYRGGTLTEGTPGTAVGNVRFNDKDGSGGFSRDSLLAYYRFDDSGTTVEDFARKAKNGLLGATAENYAFHDSGYALPMIGITLITNGAAPILGADARGADDSDGDGLPDAWEVVNNLNPYDNGTFGESAPGLKDGPNGAFGDPDGDGLNNIYEYWARTNPRDADTDNNGNSDAQEDYDGDGIVNSTEQALGSRPDIVDTDDDGFPDNIEQSNGSNPADPADPPVSRALVFGGAPNDYLDIPLSYNQRLTDFTLEALVNPATVAGNGGTIIRRAVQNLNGGSNAVNYVLGVEPNGGTLRAIAGYIQTDGTPYILRGGSIPAGTCSHVAATYNTLTATLSVYVNGILVASTNNFFLSPPVNGRGGEAFVRVGEDFQGVIDEVRVWKLPRSAAQISSNQQRTVAFTDTNLVNYFRFDDGQATNNIFPFGPFNQPAGVQDWTFTKDWNKQWRHAARFNGNVSVTDVGSCLLVPPSLRVILLPPDAVTNGAQWSVDGGAFQNSGTTLTDLTPGSHLLAYKAVANYVAPTNEAIVLSNGVATTITRTYVPYGSLVIVLDPAGARTAGAQYNIDGGAYLDSGTTNALPPGNHIITYKALSGWTAPSNETVTITSGNELSLSRFYSGDTDGDGMPDDWEIANGLDPNDPSDAGLDPDGDGLTNLEEYQHGTDPHNWDTDGDGVSDLNEILGGSDPLDPSSKPKVKEVNDFDGDTATDLAVYWAQTATWYIRNSSNLTTRVQQWGWPSAIPAPADYDGDDNTDVAVMNPVDGRWYIYESITRYIRVRLWNWGNVIPVPADYDGDNRADIATYKPENGLWSISYSLLSSSNTATSLAQNWGWSASLPVPADYDGDSKDDLAVFWPEGGYWYIRQSSKVGTTNEVLMSGAPIQWGWAEVKAVPGDYDGDRRADVAVYHPATGNWYIRKSSNGQLLGGAPIQWGWSDAIPAPGDYDKDGITDIAVYHPATGDWYIRKSSTGTIMSGGPIQFGFWPARPPRAPANY